MHVKLRLAQRERIDELAAAIAEEDGMETVTQSSLVEAPEADVVVADEAADVSRAMPLVLLTDEPAKVSPFVRAVLPKDAPADLVAAAARLAAAGYTVRKAEDDTAPHEDEEAAQREPFRPEAALSSREMQVLALLADGASNKVIARKLDISVHTAKFHVASVTAKLRARNRTDAISIALREGVLMA